VAFPFLYFRTVAEEYKEYARTYSCGYSSRFERDSLLSISKMENITKCKGMENGGINKEED